MKDFDQYKYDNYSGGNGTYVTGGKYLGTILSVKILFMLLTAEKTFDVYEDVFKLAGKKKISLKLLETIKSHEGDKIDVYTDDGSNFILDASVLLT